MRESERADGRAGGREGVQRRQREGAPHLHHARVPAAHQVLAASGQHQALEVVVMRLVPQPASVERVCGEVPPSVCDDDDPLATERQLLRGADAVGRRQRAQHLAERRVDQYRPVD